MDAEKKLDQAREILNSINPSEEQLKEAVQTVMECAESGVPRAYYTLSILYSDGRGVEQDKQKAYELACKALDMGFVRAKVLLSKFYFDGEVVEKDIEKAKTLALECLEVEEDGEAYAMMAGICLDGEERDEENGMKWLEKAVERGHIHSMIRLVHYYGNYCQDEKARYWSEKIAEAGCEDYAKGLMEMYAPDSYRYRLVRLIEYYVTSKEYQKAYDLWEQNEIPGSIFDIMPFDIDEVRRQVNDGNLDAMYQLGVRYEQGNGVEKDDDVASDWYLRAAMKGHILSAYSIGYFYYFTKQDLEDGMKWIMKAADADYNLAYHTLADIYLNGWGVDADIEKGVAYMTKAAELDDEEAQLNLAGMYYNSQFVEQDIEKAMYWFGKFFEHDSAEAHFRLGGMYYNGQIVDQDYERALEEYSIAVKRGHHAASPVYIQMLWTGDHVEKNQEEVIATYKELAEAGDAVATHYLYEFYMDEQYPGHDVETAVAYLKESAEMGNGTALFDMAMQYTEDGVFATDMDKAVEYFTKAVELGNPYAMTNLAMCYDTGRSVEKDEKKALELYIRAGEAGLDEAAMEAGKRLLSASDDETDSYNDKAIELLRRPADNNNPDSCFMLAFALFKKASGKNAYSWDTNEEAFGYMLKAAEGGERDAMYRTGYSYLEGRGVMSDKDEAKRWFLEAQKNDCNKEEIDKILADYFTIEGDRLAEFQYWYNVCMYNPALIIDKEPYTEEDNKSIIPLAVCKGAAQCGDINAMATLGYTLLREQPAEAKKHFTHVIKHGYASIAAHVGDMYMRGDTVPEDKDEAISYYHLGMEEGDLTCALQLGHIYTNTGNSKETEQMGVEILNELCSVTDPDDDFHKCALQRLEEVEYRNSSILSKASKTIKSIFGN